MMKWLLTGVILAAVLSNSASRGGVVGEGDSGRFRRSPFWIRGAYLPRKPS